MLKQFADEAAVHRPRDTVLDALHATQGNPNALWPALFNTLYAGEQAQELALRALQNVEYVQHDPPIPDNADLLTTDGFDKTDLLMCEYALDQRLPIMTCNARMYIQIRDQALRWARYGGLDFWVPGHGRIIQAVGAVLTFG